MPNWGGQARFEEGADGTPQGMEQTDEGIDMSEVDLFRQIAVAASVLFVVF